MHRENRFEIRLLRSSALPPLTFTNLNPVAQNNDRTKQERGGKCFGVLWIFFGPQLPGVAEQEASWAVVPELLLLHKKPGQEGTLERAEGCRPLGSIVRFGAAHKHRPAEPVGPGAGWELG